MNTNPWASIRRQGDNLLDLIGEEKGEPAEKFARAFASETGNWVASGRPFFGGQKGEQQHYLVICLCFPCLKTANKHVAYRSAALTN